MFLPTSIHCSDHFAIRQGQHKALTAGKSRVARNELWELRVVDYHLWQGKIVCLSIEYLQFTCRWDRMKGQPSGSKECNLNSFMQAYTTLYPFFFFSFARAVSAPQFNPLYFQPQLLHTILAKFYSQWNRITDNRVNANSMQKLVGSFW